jgi:two-component system, OmpR family, response regulator RegX3
MRIALLEDDITHATKVGGWLRDEGHNVLVFGLTRDLQQYAVRENFDLFLLDWLLPDAAGTDFLVWLRQERSDHTPAIFITVRESDDDIVTALSSGADDYLVKPIAKRVLLARIEAVMRRNLRRDDNQPVQAPPYSVDLSAKSISLGGETIPLTQKEFELALFLFRNVGRQLSRGYLLETIWGRNPRVATRTVDTHISRIRGKLQLQPENGYRITPTYNFGYRLERVENGHGDTPKADEQD